MSPSLHLPTYHNLPEILTSHPQHLLTIPAVQDSVRAFSNSSVGRVSQQLGNTAYSAYNAYSKLIPAPIISLVNKPLAYVVPYAQRVDERCDQTLTRVVERYPAVKKPSPELLRDAREAVYKPVRHVSEVYRGVYEREVNNHHHSSSTNGASPTVAERAKEVVPAPVVAKAQAAVVTGKAAVTTAAVVGVEGTILALKEALRWGEGSRIAGAIRIVIDKLEKAALRQRGEVSPTSTVNDVDAQEGEEGQRSPLKAAST
jgi:hypothetical protein